MTQTIFFQAQASFFQAIKAFQKFLISNERPSDLQFKPSTDMAVKDIIWEQTLMQNFFVFIYRAYTIEGEPPFPDLHDPLTRADLDKVEEELLRLIAEERRLDFTLRRIWTMDFIVLFTISLVPQHIQKSFSASPRTLPCGGLGLAYLLPTLPLKERKPDMIGPFLEEEYESDTVLLQREYEIEDRDYNPGYFTLNQRPRVYPIDRIDVPSFRSAVAALMTLAYGVTRQKLLYLSGWFTVVVKTSQTEKALWSNQSEKYPTSKTARAVSVTMGCGWLGASLLFVLTQQAEWGRRVKSTYELQVKAETLTYEGTWLPATHTTSISPVARAAIQEYQRANDTGTSLAIYIPGIEALAGTDAGLERRADLRLPDLVADRSAYSTSNLTLADDDAIPAPTMGSPLLDIERERGDIDASDFTTGYHDPLLAHSPAATVWTKQYFDSFAPYDSTTGRQPLDDIYPQSSFKIKGELDEMMFDHMKVLRNQNQLPKGDSGGVWLADNVGHVSWSRLEDTNYRMFDWLKESALERNQAFLSDPSVVFLWAVMADNNGKIESQKQKLGRLEMEAALKLVTDLQVQLTATPPRTRKDTYGSLIRSFPKKMWKNLSAANFRDQKVWKMAVAEQTAFTSLTSPGQKRKTFLPSKKKKFRALKRILKKRLGKVVVRAKVLRKQRGKQTKHKAHMKHLFQGARNRTNISALNYDLTNTTWESYVLKYQRANSKVWGQTRKERTKMKTGVGHLVYNVKFTERTGTRSVFPHLNQDLDDGVRGAWKKLLFYLNEGMDMDARVSRKYRVKRNQRIRSFSKVHGRVHINAERLREQNHGRAKRSKGGRFFSSKVDERTDTQWIRPPNHRKDGLSKQFAIEREERMEEGEGEKRVDAYVGDEPLTAKAREKRRKVTAKLKKDKKSKKTEFDAGGVNPKQASKTQAMKQLGSAAQAFAQNISTATGFRTATVGVLEAVNNDMYAAYHAGDDMLATTFMGMGQAKWAELVRNHVKARFHKMRQVDAFTTTPESSIQDLFESLQKDEETQAAIDYAKAPLREEGVFGASVFGASVSTQLVSADTSTGVSPQLVSADTSADVSPQFAPQNMKTMKSKPSLQNREGATTTSYKHLFEKRTDPTLVRLPPNVSHLIDERTMFHTAKRREKAGFNRSRRADLDIYQKIYDHLKKVCPGFFVPYSSSQVQTSVYTLACLYERGLFENGRDPGTARTSRARNAKGVSDYGLEKDLAAKVTKAYQWGGRDLQDALFLDGTLQQRTALRTGPLCGMDMIGTVESIGIRYNSLNALYHRTRLHQDGSRRINSSVKHDRTRRNLPKRRVQDRPRAARRLKAARLRRFIRLENRQDHFIRTKTALNVYFFKHLKLTKLKSAKGRVRTANRSSISDPHTKIAARIFGCLLYTSPSPRD